MQCYQDGKKHINLHMKNENNFNDAAVIRVAKGKQKKHKGYVFKYEK
jgi:hypothetical protein